MTEISKLNLIELQDRGLQLKSKIALMRFDKASGKLLDTKAMSKAKKELARLLTRISEVRKEQRLTK